MITKAAADQYMPRWQASCAGNSGSSRPSLRKAPKRQSMDCLVARHRAETWSERIGRPPGYALWLWEQHGQAVGSELAQPASGEGSGVTELGMNTHPFPGPNPHAGRERLGLSQGRVEHQPQRRTSSMTSSEQSGRPPGLLRFGAAQRFDAASSSHNVMSRRRRRLAPYAGQL